MKTAMEIMLEDQAFAYASKMNTLFYESLRREAPFSYWLLKLFRFRWMAKFLRIHIERRQDPRDFSDEIRILSWGKIIGKCKINYLQKIT